MELKFDHIILHNFASFSHAELSLSDLGYTLVSGRNNCRLDNAYSNGSGKSSIFNGLCFALTGETTQGTVNGLENIFADPDDCWVELSFSLDNDAFIIRRIKTPKPDMKIFINGIDKSGKGIRESSKVLAQYLPDMTSKFVDSVIILGQGLPNRFSNNNPAQRKEILEKLTKSDFMIQSIKDSLESRLDTLKAQLRTYEDSTLENKSKLSVYEAQIEQIKASLQKYNSDARSIEEVNNSIDELSGTISTVNKFIESKQAIVEQLSDKKTQLLLDYKSSLNDKLKDIETSITTLTNKVAQQKADVRVLKKEIDKLDSITDVCPTCGQKIPGANKPDTTDKKVKLSELEETLLGLEDTLAVEKDNKTTIISDSDNEYKEKDSELSTSLKDTQAEIRDYNSKLSELNVDMAALLKEKNDITLAKENINNLTNELNEVTKTIEELNKNVLALDSQTTMTNAHCSVVQQMLTLAKREFRGVLLQNFIAFINKKVKKYSQEVFGTTELSFTLNENCIDITYCGKPYENLSGGEKQKIDIIVQLALRDILSKQLNVRTNILVCDEVLDNIDSIGAEKIINIIQSQSDIESIFFITHHSDILNMSYDKVITVEKNSEGISSIIS